jgi:two-component system KDP operon response regulator KdpE
MTEPVIILIEGDRQIRRLLRTTLLGRGYRFFAAATGRDGLILAATRRPDVVIVDLALPDMDVMDLIRGLREWTSVPVIVLSAESREADTILALEAGADDLVSKPFAPEELVARVRVALRQAARTAPGEHGRFAVGDLLVDLARRQVFVAGNEVHLTPIEYRLLATLARHAGKVLTHGRILREVWGPSHEGDAHYLRIYVLQLRRKIEADPTRPRHLQTEPGVGYRLMSE